MHADGARSSTRTNSGHGIDAQTFAEVEPFRDLKSRGAAGIITSGMWLERHPNTPETFGTNSDVVTARKVVGLLLVKT